MLLMTYIVANVPAVTMFYAFAGDTAVGTVSIIKLLDYDIGLIFFPLSDYRLSYKGIQLSDYRLSDQGKNYRSPASLLTDLCFCVREPGTEHHQGIFHWTEGGRGQGGEAGR
jgi:hypothetical protein